LNFSIGGHETEYENTRDVHKTAKRLAYGIFLPLFSSGIVIDIIIAVQLISYIGEDNGRYE